MKGLLVLALFLLFASPGHAQNITVRALVDSCDISVDISVKIENERVIFKPVLNKKIKNFTLEYWIEDLDSYLVKKKINTTNLNEKQFTPEISDFVIKNRLYYRCKNESYIINASKYVNLENNNNVETENNKITNNEEIDENETDNEEIIDNNGINPKINNNKNEITNNKIIYQSKNLANIKNAKYLFLVLAATIILIFIWKRE